MGDRRFEPHYDALRLSRDRAAHLRDMTDDSVVEALAAASREGDPYIANILATEATNRMERSRSEVRHLGEGVCSLDMAGRILTANPAAEELLGRTQSELFGQDFDSLCRDGNTSGAPRATMPAYMRALTTGAVIECDTEMFYHQDGTVFDVAYTAAPVIREGAVSGAVVAFRNVSRVRHAVDALRVSEERYRALFENSPGFVFSTDLAGLIDAASASALSLRGEAIDALRGQPLAALVPPADRAALQAIFAQAKEGKAGRAEIALLDGHGALVPTSLLLMPIIVRQAVVGVYGTAERRPDGTR